MTLAPRITPRKVASVHRKCLGPIGSRRRRATDHDGDHDGGAQRGGLRTGCLRVRSPAATMGAVQVEFDQDLVDLLEERHRPVKQAARELIVLELYR